jgi:opacity protein-like surface antigen
MKKILFGSAIACALFASPVFADPNEYVHTPDVEYGEREIDFKYGSRKMSNPEASQAAASIGFGYGMSERWFTEVYLKYNRAAGTTEFDAIEWENKFQLTETGKYPVDLGFLLEIERPQAREEGYEVTFGPLLQTEFAKSQLNANLLFVRNYRADFSNRLQAKYQLQAKYRLKQEFEFGLQAFGELGEFDNWNARNDQSHRAGPAIFGKLPLGNRTAIKYNAAYLIGKTEAINGKTFRMQVEYEF